MVIDSPIQWILTYLYDAAVLLLLVGGVFWLRSRWSVLASILILGLAAHLLGNYQMRHAFAEVDEARQESVSASPAAARSRVWRAVSAIGFAGAGVAFLVLSWKATRERSDF